MRRERVPFMLPLSKLVSELLIKMNTWLIGKPYPESGKEILEVIGFHGLVMTALSIPIALLVG